MTYSEAVEFCETYEPQPAAEGETEVKFGALLIAPTDPQRFNEFKNAVMAAHSAPLAQFVSEAEDCQVIAISENLLRNGLLAYKVLK